MVKETDALRAVQPPLPRGDMAEMVERIKAQVVNPQVEVKKKDQPHGR